MERVDVTRVEKKAEKQVDIRNQKLAFWTFLVQCSRGYLIA